MEPVVLCPVTALLERGGILYGVPGTDKTSVITATVERMPLPAGVDRDGVIEGILRREDIASTGTGGGVAIPHPQNCLDLQLTESILSLAFLAQPIDFDAPDGKPVQALFVLLSANTGEHLRVLAHLGRMLQCAEVRQAITSQLPSEPFTIICCRAEAAASLKRSAKPPG